MDTFSKSDPRCTVYELVNNKWIKRGKTESLNNTLNPDFDKHIELDYYFEKS